MTVDHTSVTLTGGEVASLLDVHGSAVGVGSPLLPFKQVEPDTGHESVRARIGDNGAWDAAFGVLLNPDRQIRAIIPGPSETMIQTFYANRSLSDAGIVGCWLEGDRLRISFPWDEEDIAAVTSHIVLVTMPPLAGSEELALSLGGFEAFAGAVDAVRGRLFDSLTVREPATDYRFAPADVVHQIETGKEHNDARWLVTLLRILAPAHLRHPGEANGAGFDELVTTGIVRTDNGQWIPQPALMTYSSHWRSPLPAVAHEIIEIIDGEIHRYDHRITLRGDGPLTVVDYDAILSGHSTVTLRSVDAPEYLDALVELMRHSEDQASTEWVYVLDPTEVRGLTDTASVVGSLLPGVWYVLVSEASGWARVAHPEGQIEGWVRADQIHQRSQVVDTTPEPEPADVGPVAGFVWEATHTVPVSGLDAWAEPDPTGPVLTTLAGGVELQVLERRADWAHVRAHNGWEAWVDGRRILPTGT